MPFGTQLSNPQHYYYEQNIVLSSLNQVVAQGAAWNFNATSTFTMPWAGEILADGYVQVGYTPSVLGVELWPSSAIAPTNFWAGKRVDYEDNGGVVLCPFFGRWGGLSAGTPFILTLQVRIGAANGTATAQSFSGSMRAMAV